MIDFLPNDLRLTLAQDLISSKNISLKMLVADREVGKLILKKI
jgi:hypothetical protein